MDRGGFGDEGAQLSVFTFSFPSLRYRRLFAQELLMVGLRSGVDLGADGTAQFHRSGSDRSFIEIWMAR